MKPTKIVFSLLVLFSLSLLQGCGDNLLDLNFSQYKIENLESKTYVGSIENPAPTSGNSAQLPSEVVIKYTNKPDSIKITVNGYPVGDKAVINDANIKLSYSDIKEFLRQGDNTLQVAPNNFGPMVRFSFVDEGPKLDVIKVEDLGEALNVRIQTRSQSSIQSMDIQAVSYDYQGGYDDVDGNMDFKTASYTDIGESISLVKNSQDIWENTSQIDKSNMYKITATDEYGYVTEDYYLKAGEKISNLFKLRLSKNMLDVATKILKPQVQNTHGYSQLGYDYLGGTPPADAEPSEMLDSMNEWWTSGAVFFGDTGNGAHTGNEANCGYVDSPRPDMSTSTCVKYDVDKDNKQYCTQLSWDHNGYNGKEGKCSRIIMKRMKLNNVDKFVFTLDPARRSELKLDMVLNGGMNVDMGIRHVACGSKSAGEFVKKEHWSGGVFGCGTWGTCTKTTYYRENENFCYDDGPAKAALGIANLGNMEITANGVSPEGNIKVDIKNGDLDLGFRDVKLNLSGTKIGGSMSGVGDFIVFIEGLLDGMFVNIVHGVLKSNLSEFLLGFDLYTDYDQEHKPSLAMQAHAFNVWTNGGEPGVTDNNVEWYMEYAGYLKPYEENLSMVNDNDPDAVHSILGSRFIPQDTKMPEANAETDMNIAVNINFINQVLTSMYLSGITHVTVGQLKSGVVTEFGFNQKENLEGVQIGDKLVELIPRTPGYIELDSTDSTANGTIYYRNAKMLIQTYNAEGWHVDFNVSVDMQFGVHMSANDDKFQMTLLGAPSLDIQKINTCSKNTPNDECRGDGGSTIYENSTTHSNSQLTFTEEAIKFVVQFGVDMVLNYLTPVLAEQFAELDYPRVAIPFTKVNGEYEALKLKTKNISTNNQEHLTFALKTENQNNCVLKPEDEDKLIEADNKILVFCDDD